MMEQTSDPPYSSSSSCSPPDNQPAAHGLYSKRLKELENAALQTSLISRMETEPGAEQQQQQQQPAEGEQPSGVSLSRRPEPSQLHAATEEPQEPEPQPEEPGTNVGTNVAKERVEEERTLTDHLNKRLLSSFLEKLNERDLALPSVQRLDCAVADEDSNRAAEEEW